MRTKVRVSPDRVPLLRMAALEVGLDVAVGRETLEVDGSPHIVDVLGVVLLNGPDELVDAVLTRYKARSTTPVPVRHVRTRAALEAILAAYRIRGTRDEDRIYESVMSYLTDPAFDGFRALLKPDHGDMVLLGLVLTDWHLTTDDLIPLDPEEGRISGQRDLRRIIRLTINSLPKARDAAARALSEGATGD